MTSFIFLLVGLLFCSSFVESMPSQCLHLNITSAKRYLLYPDNSLHPVMIPYPSWASARVLAQIAKILVSEVMNYASELFVRDTLHDSFFVADVIGCQDFVGDEMCTKINDAEPNVHFTLETWDEGAQWNSLLPDYVRPALLNVLDYFGDDSYYLWRAVVEDCLTFQSGSAGSDLTNDSLSHCRLFCPFTRWAGLSSGRAWPALNVKSLLRV